MKTDSATTDLEALAEELRAADASPHYERPLRAAAIGERLEALGVRPDTLATVAEWVTSLAMTSGCSRLVGASRFGQTVVGAAVALSDGRLRCYQAPEAAEGGVLVVDGILVTGSQLADTATALRQDGVVRVVGAVVLAAQPPGAQLRQLVDDLVVLTPA